MGNCAGNCFGLNSKSDKRNKERYHGKPNGFESRRENMGYKPRIIREKVPGIHNKIARLDI